MKTPTVYEVGRIINGMSLEHYNRFMGHPLDTRMGIISEISRKGGLLKITKLIRKFSRTR